MNTEAMDMGMNRTGLGMSPILGAEMIEGASQTQPSSEGDERDLMQARQDFAHGAEPIGSMPPPSSLKGAAKAAIQALKGQKPTVLLDKLGERLAFERSGSRLYEALLSKYDAEGSWEGGPRRADLESFLADEMGHFEMLREALELMGADPTAVTPSADLAAVEALGVQQVLTDARTGLHECLHAILVAELVDHDGWKLLIDLSREVGQDELATRFENALRAEDRHLAAVRAWVADGVQRAAKREAA